MRPLTAAAAALGYAVLIPLPAQAQDAGLQGVFTGSVGVTDNVDSISEEDAIGPEADGFGSVGPGLIFRYDTPRTSQSLSYLFTASFFFQHSEANAYTNTAAWSGRFVTTPTTELTLGATGTQGELNALVRSQPPGQTALNAQPSGSTVFVQGGLSEGFTKQLSPVVSAGQLASFLVYSPLTEDPQRTYNVANTLNAQRLWRRDTGALALTFAYTHFENTANDSPDQLLNTLVASWQHDYMNHFSSQLDLGVTQATDLSGEYAQLWQPAGLAALRYVREEAQAELAVTHAAQLNVFLQQIVLVDQATLRLALPIHRRARLDAEGSGGVQLGHPIEAGVLGDPTTVLLADAALIWRPITVIPDFELALRYQHTNQLGTTLTSGGQETDTQLVRNTVVLSVGAAFPRRTETGTRILMTQPFGSAPATRRTRQEAPPPEPEESGGKPE